MSERIMTLFGEEIVPEQLKAVGKSRTRKKTDGQDDDAADLEAEQQETPPAEAAAVAEESSGATQQEQPQEEVETTPTGRLKKKKAAPGEETITLAEDWQGDKKYYSIGEVAELFKVNTSHIRFWTNEFKLKVRTTRKGDRLYTPEQIRELRTIHHLVRERGFTLAGARAKLKAQNNRDVQTIDLKQSLLQLRNKLVIIKNQLT